MSDGLPPEDWPLRAASRCIRVAPQQWHVQVTGTGDEDVLLLHGAGASSHSWHRLIPYLDDRFRMIAPDLPGHGYTQSPRGRARLPDVAQDISRLLEHMSVAPRMIIAHSAGAAIALEMVRRGWASPDRVVVINGALEDFKGPAGVLFPVMARVMALNPLTGMWLSQRNSPQQVRSLIGATGTTLDERALRLYGRLVARRSHVDGTLAMMAQWSLSELNKALGSINVPTLFLHGREDQAVNIAVAERACARMPNAELILLSGVGHIAQEEAPERVAQEILAFCARQSAFVDAT